MKPEEIRAYLAAAGWIEDGYGHMKKKVEDRQYRAKFQKTSIRVEVRCDIPADKYSKASFFWSKLCSDYFKHVRIQPDGRLKIGARLLKGAA